jgi:glucan endo-1,3-beta-D-glucosidase
MHTSHLLAFALSLATSNAVYQGFNYGATQTDGSYKQQSDFQDEFKTAKALVGSSGFTSARLYTMLVRRSNPPPSNYVHVCSLFLV